MNDLMIFDSSDDKTPIETLLKVDGDGRVSAKNVYNFLGLTDKNYARWGKLNIEDNEFAESEVDYIPSSLMKNGNITLDYRLSVPFAKKLCMLSKTERGEQARNYFVKVENMLKNVMHNLPQLTTNEMILQLATNNVELERRHNELENRVKQLELDNVSELDPQYYIEATNHHWSKYLYTTTDIAKAFGMSAMMLNRLLYNQDIIHPYKSGWIINKRKCKESYMHLKQGDYKQKDGTTRTIASGLWTHEGMTFLTQYLKERGFTMSCSISKYERKGKYKIAEKRRLRESDGK